MSCTIVLSSPVKALLATVEHVFQPALAASTQVWGGQLANDADGSGRKGGEFLTSVGRFVGLLSDAVHGVEGGVELVPPSIRNTDTIEQKPAAYARVAAMPDVVASYEEAVRQWCATAEALMGDLPIAPHLVPEGTDGLPSEIEYWKVRLQKFVTLSEQSRSHEYKVVREVLALARPGLVKTWRALEGLMADQANEAKDNVRYLSTLDKFVEPLSGGLPREIAEALPGVLAAVKMFYAISRYYSSEERLTTLMCKLTNQLVSRCTEYLLAPGKLWDQPFGPLVERLGERMALEEAYRDEYRRMVEGTRGGDKRQLDLDERLCFGKLELLVRRLAKLSELFETVQAFTELAQHKLEGMDDIVNAFASLVAALKAKPYSLLDFTAVAFDADFVDFRASIEDLETALQGFINRSFETITSTEAALSLLRRYQAILRRERLRADLDAKLTVVFHNYGIDLETSQRLYERAKAQPPTVRNAPPVTASIMWARQLMRRIEEPMVKFQMNKNLMSTKESKKIVKTYNRIARTIVEFETLWHLAWSKSIEQSKAGLQATLIIRHPSNNKLYVNFDREILQLIRETKCLMRMGIAVPESARMVVIQEPKFKAFYNQLTHGIGQYEAVLARLMPVAQPLLKPFIADVEARLLAGLTNLTWTSVNIDAFLQSLSSGVGALEELAQKAKDVIENRIERNLKQVSNLCLVELPTDESCSHDKFVQVQERHIKGHSATLAAKGLEVEEAVVDLVDLIATYPLSLKDGGTPAAAACSAATASARRRGCARTTARCGIGRSQCDAARLHDIKRRVGSRSSGGFLFVDRPIFDVNVELAILHDDGAVARRDPVGHQPLRRSILAIAKQLPVWASADDKASGRTVFDHLSTDRDIVVVVLHLTGALEGTKRHVLEYLETFAAYHWLWRGNKEAEYASFMRSRPSLADFEEKLRFYASVDRQIGAIAPVHNIGALSLETAPLKYSLRSEAAAWKALFGEHLHEQASGGLDATLTWMGNLQRNLKRELRDLDDVRLAMEHLKEVREREGSIEELLRPVEEMYAALGRYDVFVAREEADAVADLRANWRKLSRCRSRWRPALARAGRVQARPRQERQGARRRRECVPDGVRRGGADAAGLEPQVANDRLQKFKAMYESRERRMLSYQNGEALFGLPVTDYPS